MHDPALVRVSQCGGHIAEDSVDALEGAGASLVQHLAERASGNELHDEREASVAHSSNRVSCTRPRARR